METNILNGSYFRPLVSGFIAENKSLILESGYPYGLFIPYVFPKYYSSPIKIFYIGRDTYYWIPKDEMLNSFVEDNLNSYFDKNSSAVNTEKTFEWGNGSGSFWGFVNKLHLYIRTNELKDLNNLEENDIEILKEVGYGNVNCMELNKTLLNNEGRSAEDFDWDKLWLLRMKSKMFDSVAHIINAYQPDIVVILNWMKNPSSFIEELNYVKQEDLYKDSISAVYLSDKVKTKVIWSSHPRRFSFIGENQESMAHELGDLVLKLSNK